MKQALTYAIFIAKLLQSYSGQLWYDFFKNYFNKPPKDNSIPKTIDIDVVTIMPTGKTEEITGDFEIPEISTILRCHTIYYDKQEYDINNIFKFSGTYTKLF